MKKSKFKIARTSNNLGTFKDAEMDWFFKRTLEYANSGAADIGDCMSVVSKIDESNIETWISAWEQLGTRLENEAEDSLQRGHNISARDAYLRASNYYRAAEYAALPNHPKFHKLWERSRNCFHKACPLFDPPIQILDAI